jgi:hypothetical protein
MLYKQILLSDATKEEIHHKQNYSFNLIGWFRQHSKGKYQVFHLYAFRKLFSFHLDFMREMHQKYYYRPKVWGEIEKGLSCDNVYLT